MSETIAEDREFRSPLFSAYPNELEGEAGDVAGPNGIDPELQHEDWPNWQSARRAARHLLGMEAETTWGVASYGYTVYRALQEEPEVPDAVYLDSRCFDTETDLLDVLKEAAECAIDDRNIDLVAPIVTGMIHTANLGNFAGGNMKKYLGTVMRSVDAKAIRIYVEFMNEHTPKHTVGSKDFLKHMAHAVQALPEKGIHRDDPGLDRLDKQILLEDISHAWIRKAWPVAEIDWLP
jgi:hypothetical protein